MLTGSKKELGMALNEVKSATWYSELSQEDKDYVIQETKDFYTPPDKYENTLLNLWIGKDWDVWTEHCRRFYPHYNGEALGGAEVRMLKRRYVSEKLKQTK